MADCRYKNLLGILFYDPGHSSSFRYNEGVTGIKNMSDTVFLLNNFDASLNDIAEFEFGMIVFPATCCTVLDARFKITGAVVEVGPVIGVRLS